MAGTIMRHQNLFLLMMGLLLSLRLDDARASESSSNPQNNLPDITTFAFRSSSSSSSSQSHSNHYPLFNNQNDNDINNSAKDEENQSAKNNEDEGASPSSREEEEEGESAVFSSSLLFDGGCVVSTEAIMCSGGDMNNNNHNGFAGSSSSSSSSSSSMMDYFDYFYDDEDEESDDDDDDDDDNDGHSSMLSNASLRRSKVGAGGYHSHRYESSSSSSSSQQQQQQQNTKKRDDIVASSLSPPHGRKSYHLKQLQQQQQQQQRRRPFSSVEFSSTVTTKALSVRGGGGVAAATGEFAQKLLVTALVTLVFEFMIGHSLEFVKISMQTSQDGTSYGSVLQRITAEKGIAGLWDGFCPWGVIQSIFKGSVFGLAHAMATSAFLPLAESGTIPMQLALTVAGGIGGGFQGFVLSPTLLLKTRVMTNPVFREKMSLWKTTVLSAKIGSDVVATEGIGALMKGAGVFSTKRVCDWASRYYFSDLFESLAKQRKGGASLSVGEKMACSLLGGTASTIVTLPLDVLVAKIQDAKKAGVSCSAWKLFQDELSQKGWNGLKNSYMKGFEARLLHVALTTVAIKTGTPIAYELLFPAKEATSSS